MHEYSLMEQVIENILETLKQKDVSESEKIRELSLNVGSLDIHSVESFKQAFSMLVEETPLKGAELKIHIAPAWIECVQCNRKSTFVVGDIDGHDPTPVKECPHCGKINNVEGGRGISNIEIELVEET